MRPWQHQNFRYFISLIILAVVVIVAFKNTPDSHDEKNMAQEPKLSFVDKLIRKTSTDDLTGIRARKYLRALVTYSRTDFIIMDNGKPAGLQVELLNQYEKFLNKGIKQEVDKVKIILVPTTFDHLLKDLMDGKGDLAAALLTITPERLKQVAFVTGAAMKVDELVVVHKSVTGIQTITDLAGREVYVLRNSSYAEHLRNLNTQLVNKGLQAVIIKEMDSHLLSEDILEMVNAGTIPITIIDDYKARTWADILPDIQVLNQVKIKTASAIGWAVRKNNPELQNNLSAFAKSVSKGTLLGNIFLKRYLNVKWIRNPLAENEKSKFQHVIGIFSKYADLYGFDVLAIVAQAYQESGLDQNKRSGRGAIGIMQLLPSTAAGKNVGIDDISSMENNIHAGVKYLAFLRDHYFSASKISEKNRLAFMWAAYNAGPAKVIKMRKKAEHMGLNPDVWFGNVELAAAKIAGRETIQYVRNIFKFYIVYSRVRHEILPQPESS